MRTLREAADREPHSYVPWVLSATLPCACASYDGASAYYGRASLLNPRDSDLLAIARDPRSALQ